MNYQNAKRRQRLRAALRNNPGDTETEYQPLSLRGGWRLTDGQDYPVTTTRLADRKEPPDDRHAR